MATMSDVPTWRFGVTPSRGVDLDELVDAIASGYGGTVRLLEGDDTAWISGPDWAVEVDDVRDDPFGDCPVLVYVRATSAQAAHDIAQDIIGTLDTSLWSSVPNDPEFGNPELDPQATRAAS